MTGTVAGRPHKLGRKPNDPAKPRIRLATHLTTTTPPPPAVLWTSVPKWGILGNDDYGDCVFAGNGHLVEILTAYGRGTETTVTTAETLSEYARVTGFDPHDPTTDSGAAIQDGLGDLRTHGLAGHKIAAYAEVNPHETAEIQTAVAELGPLSAGVNLPASAMTQFGAGEPWEAVADDGGIEGGHCIVLAGYDPQWLYFVTWGRVQKATYGWWEKYGEEIWAVVARDWAGHGGTDPEGVDLRTLAAEFATITGEPPPFPVHAPAPAPGDRTAAALFAELAAKVREIAASADRDVSEAVAWIRDHGL